VPTGAVTSRNRGFAGATGRGAAAWARALDGAAGLGLGAAFDGAGAVSTGAGAGSTAGAVSGVELAEFCSFPAQPIAKPDVRSATAIHWVLMMSILWPIWVQGLGRRNCRAKTGSFGPKMASSDDRSEGQETVRVGRPARPPITASYFVGTTINLTDVRRQCTLSPWPRSELVRRSSGNALFTRV
jgi:hypothetical protein